MKDTFESIYNFNKESGLLEKGYSDFLEPSFLIEEALEDLNALPNLAMHLNMKDEGASPKEIAREIVSLANYNAELTDLQRFDKHIDAIVYAVGGAYKLGLSPKDIEDGIAAVMHSNMKKVGAGKDEHGKALKPDNWEEIEAEQVEKLQEILNRRSKV